MFEKISLQMKSKCPDWWVRDERFWRLERYDRLLNGTFYNHLPYAFYDEVEGTPGNERMIPISMRRPSTQYGIPAEVARMTSRKLFAGRHVPRIKHPDPETQKFARKICRRAKLYGKMLEIAFMGSVGSVAATFMVSGEGKDQRVKICPWPAKFCVPTFDVNGELEKLVVQYITQGASISALGQGSGVPQDEEANWFWFRREWTSQQEITYQAVSKDDWNPADGFVSEAAKTRGWAVWDDQTTKHEFGFVPAHWFKNLAGGQEPDGKSTWGPAIPNSIDIDYTLSQIGRGVRYNAAPQLVVIGDPAAIGGGGGSDDEGAITRDPLTYIRLGAGIKTEEGDVQGRGDAKLLEMTGTGIEAGLKYIETVRKQALEQIQAARKDPEQMKGPMSGRAMEYLDDEWHDLVMELRTAYGDEGFLPFIRKIIAGCASLSGSNTNYATEALSLRWPRLFQPTPTDLAQIMPAFQIAVDPLGTMQPALPAQPGGATGGPGTPAQAKVMPTEDEQFMTVKEVRNWLRDNMDLGIYDEGEDDEMDEDDDPSLDPTDPDPSAPSPAPDGGGPDPEEDMHNDDDGGHLNSEIVVGAVRRVTAGSPQS